MDERRPGAAGAVVPAAHVTVSAEAVRVGGGRPADAGGEPKIHLVREDGVVRAIEVTCRCGEVIRIHCDYK